MFKNFNRHYSLPKLLLHFIWLVLLSTPKLYSQNTDLPFKAALTAGAAIPVGKFTNTAPDTNFLQRKSAALLGPAVTISFSYKFKNSQFGVSILGGWQQNNVDDSAIARSMMNSNFSGSELAVKSDNWHIWKLLAGPIFELPLKQKGKTNLEFGLLGGIIKTNIPGAEFEGIYTNPPMSYFAAMSKIPLPTTFCYQLNVGINYQITHELSLAGNLSFMHAKPVHTYTYYLDPPYFIVPVHVHQDYPISSINLMVGIAYAF